MTKNLYKTIYKDQYTEFTLETVKEKNASDKRLTDLGVEFTTEKVNHLKKKIN